MHALHGRIHACKGHNVAVVAVARKLAVLFYCMLTREEDYAHQQPSLTAQKLRRLELAAGGATVKGNPSGTWATRDKMRQAEKQLAAQAEASYKRSIADWKAASPKREKAGASVTAGRAKPKGPAKRATSRGRPRSSPGWLLFDTSSGSRPSPTERHGQTSTTSTNTNEAQNRRHERPPSAHDAIQRHTTHSHATYLARNRTQIPSNIRPDQD